MIGARIVVLLFTLADRSLRKPIDSEASANHPPATHRNGEKAMRHIRPSTQTRKAEAQRWAQTNPIGRRSSLA